MSFFNSELVQQEMEEIAELQETLMLSVFRFPNMTKTERLVHLENLSNLLEKQRILYTRLSLSDDPEAIAMRERILESARSLGLPAGMDISYLFNDVSRVIESLRTKLDTGSYS